MKLKIAAGLAILAVAALAIAFLFTSAVWQSFFAGLSSSLLVAAIGVIAVNIYFESHARKNAVGALFILSQRAIAEFHNLLLNLAWAEFGRETYGGIQQEFIKSKMEPTALKKDVRNAIYKIYTNSPELRQNMLSLEASLAELSRMIGWSLDANILGACLAARTAIAELSATQLDGSEKAIDQVTARLFQVDMLSQSARGNLMQIAGIAEQ